MVSWGSSCISASAPSRSPESSSASPRCLVREHRIGLQFEGLPQRRDRVGVPAEHHVREAETAPGLAVHRIAAHQFLVDGDRTRAFYESPSPALPPSSVRSRREPKVKRRAAAVARSRAGSCRRSATGSPSRRSLRHRTGRYRSPAGLRHAPWRSPHARARSQARRGRNRFLPAVADAGLYLSSAATMRSSSVLACARLSLVYDWYSCLARR